jgi:hypothetical protein
MKFTILYQLPADFGGDKFYFECTDVEDAIAFQEQAKADGITVLSVRVAEAA